MGSIVPSRTQTYSLEELRGLRERSDKRKGQAFYCAIELDLWYCGFVC